MQKIKILTGILFVLGIGWALIGWIVVFMPFTALRSDSHLGAIEIFCTICASLLSLLGYQIWIGWGIRCYMGDYIFRNGRIFWSISLAAHLAWALLIPLLISSAWQIDETFWSFWSKPDDIWMTGEGLPYRTWIILNIIVASSCLILRVDKHLGDGQYPKSSTKLKISN